MTTTTTTTSFPGGSVDPLDGIQIIDCDAHLTEPPDLWTSRVPASATDRVPIQRTVDGRTSWFLGGAPWASTGGNTIRVGRQKVLGEHIIQPFDEVDPCAYSVPERLKLLDDLGIYAQVLYPNGIGFASNHIFAIEDIADRTMVLQVYNDFLVDVQQESGDRLLPQAMLPIWDMDLTVKEMTRLIDEGIRGFTLSDRPELLGLPELPEPYFDPMWDLLNTSGAVANFHIGSGARREDMERGRARSFMSKSERDALDHEQGIPQVAAPAWRYFDLQRSRTVSSAQIFMSNVRIITNLCMSDLFDRYENLRVVSAESGIGWVPFILESMDYQFAETVTKHDEVNFASKLPSEFFQSHMFVMFWFESVDPSTIDAIGSDRVLVETDVPHPTCLYPGAREHFAEALAGVDSEVRRMILRDNGAKLYSVDVPTAARAS